MTEKKKAARRPPSVFENVLEAIFASDDDTRPLWFVSVGEERRIVRASTEHQARQAMLESITEVARITQASLNRIMEGHLRLIWEKRNATTDQSSGVEHA